MKRYFDIKKLRIPCYSQNILSLADKHLKYWLVENIILTLTLLRHFHVCNFTNRLYIINLLFCSFL